MPKLITNPPFYVPKQLFYIKNYNVIFWQKILVLLLWGKNICVLGGWERVKHFVLKFGPFVRKCLVCIHCVSYLCFQRFCHRIYSHVVWHPGVLSWCGISFLGLNVKGLLHTVDFLNTFWVFCIIIIDWLGCKKICNQG